MCKKEEKKVNGYIVAYRLKGGKPNDVKCRFLAHYTKEEAQDLFIEYAKVEGINDKIVFLTCYEVNKSKRNFYKGIFTKEYVDKEIANLERIKKAVKA